MFKDSVRWKKVHSKIASDPPELRLCFLFLADVVLISLASLMINSAGGAGARLEIDECDTET